MGYRFGGGQSAGGVPGGPPAFPAPRPTMLPSIGFPAYLRAATNALPQQMANPFSSVSAAPPTMAPTGPQPPAQPGPRYGLGGERSFFTRTSLLDFKPPEPATVKPNRSNAAQSARSGLIQKGNMIYDPRSNQTWSASNKPGDGGGPGR